MKHNKIIKNDFQMTDIDKKFEKDNKCYFEYFEKINSETPPIADLIHQFPVFVGSVNLARFLCFYEIYNLTKDLSGDILDIGTWKGFSFFSFAKFVKIFEPYSNTTVHCMEWFAGMSPENIKNSYEDCSEENLNKLIKLQDLDGIAYVHNINLLKDLPDWCKDHPWQRFKLIFLDCGLENVMDSVFLHLWDRLIPGGIMVFDHFNNPCSPQESNLVSKYCEGRKVMQMKFTRSPTGYIKK